MSTCTRIAVFAKDVRHGDVLLEQRRAIIDHSEWDVDMNDEPVVMLVPQGSDHGGWWYHHDAIVTVHRHHPHRLG